MCPLSLQWLKGDVEAAMQPRKRKLRAGDDPLLQFQALRQLPRLSQADCREVISLLRDDDLGRRTGTREHHAYPHASKLMRQLWSGQSQNVPVYVNSLPDLLQAKVDACPLFARLLSDAWEEYDGRLTFVVFSDDATPGNILAARQPKKSCMIYASFLELKILFQDSCWPPLSNMRNNEITEKGYSHAEYLRCVLEYVHDACQHGIAITLRQGASLVWICKVLVLGDHEGLRAFAGCKGAAGLKPCWRCVNVISGNRRLPPGHVHLGNADTTLLRLQTDDGLQAVVAYLRGCRNKTELQEGEKLLGWCLSSMEKGILGSTSLQDWISIESLYVDSMHQFYANGLVGQDIGLWYALFKQNGFDLCFLQRWVGIGWKTLMGGPSPKECCNDKLFREGQDFRGDADTTLQALPLIASFYKEMLADNVAMQPANEALFALQEVSQLLQRTKVHPDAARHLPGKLKRYKEKWDVAYAAVAWARPKFHYSLRLQSQIQKWHRHIDCFVGERKHRVFKSIVAPRLSQLSCFTRSTLFLQLTEIELTTSHLESEYTGRLLGKATQDVNKARELGLPDHVVFGKGIQIYCVEYSRGTFVQMSATCSIEIIHGLAEGDSLSVLVHTLQAMPEASILKWKRLSRGTEIIAASALRQHEPMRLLREDQDGLCLLR